jgi:hypothetical protein
METKTAPATAKHITLLQNALRFEKAKNKVLLDEVIAAEDEIVNRELDQYGDAIQNDTREFWRDQLLTNREKATVALAQFVAIQNRTSTATGTTQTRRPLHNRSEVKIKQPNTQGKIPADAEVSDDKAVEIRNRAKEIRTEKGIPFSHAFRQAEKEILNKVR